MRGMPMKNFTLEQEVICGHLVTTDTKKLWSVQLELLDLLKVICRKHNIKYFASAGTLLGAVRHKGYIPWDDDIDIVMFADDYEKFCEVAPQEIYGDYFFQHFKTEPGFSAGMARIRKSSTTACTKYEYNCKFPSSTYNFGIFIDIFPLNYIPTKFPMSFYQKVLYKIFAKIISGYRKECLMRKNNNSRYRFSKGYLLWKLVSNFVSYEQVATTYYSICNMCKQSDLVGLFAFGGFNKKLMWKTEWWKETCELQFENTTIVCPKKYDSILKTEYGDYMIYKKGTAVHTMQFFSADIPYKDKLKNFKMER